MLIMGFTATKNKLDLRNVLGGIPGLFDESNFEREIHAPSAVKEMGGAFFEGLAGLAQDITGMEDGRSLESQAGPNKLTIGGKTELKFNENQARLEKQEKDRKETDRQKTFYQSLKDEQLRAQMAKDRMWLEEEINDIASNISLDEKNELLHYQASYKDKSVYQKAELRKKLIEIRKRNENKQKEVSIPSPAKQPSALEGAFEGRSGTQGSGTANLSAHATG